MASTSLPPAAPTGPVEDPARDRRVGLVVAAIVVTLTLAVGALLLAAVLPGDGLPRNPVGVDAPTFSLPTLDGDDLALADLRGRPVVLTFWASWCGTCKADMPAIQRVADRWADRDVAVVGVVIDDTLPAAREVAAEQALRYPSVLDVDGEVAQAYSVAGTPETYLVGADGRVAARWIGPLPSHELELQLAIATEATG